MNEMKKAPDNIFLIGGRACGKSTIGKLLAAKINMNFLDMDKAIEEQEGKSILQLVESEGWSSFRKKEKALLEKLSRGRNMVVATGGGAVLHQEVWPAVMKANLVVWLNADVKTVRSRLKNDAATAGQRPSLTGGDILSEAEKIMAEREPLYQNGSHLQVNTDQPVETIVEIIEKGMEDGKRARS